MPFITTIDSGEKNLTIFNKAQYNVLENITNDKDLVHKKYVDDAVAGGGSGSGFPLTQNESAGGYLITNLGTAINSGDSLNLGTADNRYLKLTSGTTQTVNSDVNINGTVSGITKSMVGLGNVDNTSDAAKPISTATQTALNLKADTTALANYALLTGATFTGNITIPAATSGGHALNRDTGDSRYVNVTGDTMSNTLTMSGGNIVISSGVLQQQATASGSNQFERPLSLGANASIQQNTSAPTNTLGPSTITSLTTNNQTEIATGGATQTAMGGVIATSADREDNAQHIIRLNSTASTTGANSIVRHFRRHTTHDANWKLMKSLTDGSAAKGTNFGYALTADSHENVRLKWFPSSTVASDQDLITYTRNNITFNQPPSWGTNPSSTAHLCNKSYVDSVAGNTVKTNTNSQQIVPTTPANANTLQIEANGVGGSAVISYTSNVSNTTATHRILNLGTGDCLRVEDSSSDSSLVRVDNNGRLGVNMGTGSMTNTFEAISQGNATSLRVNNDIELSSVSDIYLGAGGQALNRPNIRITYSGNADSNFQRAYFQLGNVTANGNGKFTFSKWASNEGTLNICPEIRTVSLGVIDTGTTSTNETLGIWGEVSKASIRFIGSAKNSGVPAMDINSQGRIVNCLDPTANQDVATKKYVDDNSIVRRYTRWSNQGVAFSWGSGSNAMYYSSDGTSTLIADTDATTVLTANDRRANRGSLSTYIEFVSITNAFQQATVHCWRALIAGEYSFKFKARMNDGASNYYSQLIYRDVATGTNIRMDECWFSTDEGQRRFQFYESRIYMKVNDYANFEFGNITGGVVRPVTMNAHAYIEVTVEYLGA